MTVKRRFVVRHGLLAEDSSTITGDLTVDSDIIVGGLVDGRDVAVDGTKLDGIESNATADQTANEVFDLIKTLDSDGSGLNADTLDGQQGSFYLAYANFTGTPNVLDSGQVQGIVDSNAVTANEVMSLIQTLDSNNSGLNAATLDGQEGSYYLAYANFTGTPSVLDSGQIQGMIDSNEVDYTLDFVTGNGNTTTNSITVEDATINGLITLADSTAAPLTTTNKLYAVGGRLYWNNFVLDSDKFGGDALTANDIMSLLQTVDSNASGLNADTLDGQQGTYYLDYGNFTNTPDPVTANLVMSLIQTVDSDGSGLNADTLDGQQGSYYLAYANLTGAPNVLDSANVQAIVDSNALSANDIMSLVQTLDSNNSGLNAATLDGQEGSYYLDYNNFTNTPAAVTANYVMSLMQTVDSDGSGLNADTLDGQQGSYYLAYANFTGTPNVLDSGQVQGIVDSNALTANDIMSLVQTLDSNSSGLNADTLDGQQGTYYLDYTNFSNTPNVLDSANVQGIVDSNFQFAFTTIAVSGQSDVIADDSSDTLTFVAGTNMTITTDAGSDTVTFAASGGGSSPWVIKSGNYTAVDGDRIIADTTGGTFTITLPASPTNGNEVVITDGADLNLTNVTVGRNGNTIEDSATDVIIDVSDVMVHFIWDSDTWQVTANVGQTGWTGSQGIQGWTGSIGFTGSQGIQGWTGSRGFTGSQGDVAGVEYTFSTTITDADPGNGVVRYNNATFGSITQLFIDNADSSGTDVSAWIDTFDNSTNTIKGTIYVKSAQNEDATLSIFDVNGAVTDGTGYRKVAVSPIAGSVPTNGEQIRLTFAPAGDLGFTGSQGIQGWTGSLGFTGSRGFTGSQGTTGFTGSQGIKGDSGFGALIYDKDGVLLNG